jgi:hypothetical protein
MSAGGATVRTCLEIGPRDILRTPGYPLGEREARPYNRRVKITMSVTLSTKDVVDATAARLADPDDRSHISDPGELRPLCGTAGVKSLVIGCLSARPASARVAGLPGYPYLGVGKSR